MVQHQPGNVYLGSDRFAVTPAPLAGTLVSEFPEVTHATTIDTYSALLSRDDQHFYEEGLWADVHLFEVFTFPLLQGTPETALGKHFKRWGDEGPVVGVVKDFHMHSLHQPIQPLMFTITDDWVSFFSVRIRAENIPGTLAFLEETMGSFSPYPFEHEFLDETFDKLYKAEIKLGETFGYFTLLALLIASLGLFGLAAFSAEQRTKEVGVRKVLGASVPGIVLLLSKEFTKLVGVAFVVAVPVAYLAMNGWLEDFAYRIDIGVGIFATTIAVVLVIAWVSVSYQAFKAARVNPVQSLHYE